MHDHITSAMGGDQRLAKIDANNNSFLIMSMSMILNQSCSYIFSIIMNKLFDSLQYQKHIQKWIHT